MIHSPVRFKATKQEVLQLNFISDLKKSVEKSQKTKMFIEVRSNVGACIQIFNLFHLLEFKKPINYLWVTNWGII